MDTIFIQIASYRDIELPKTIKSALEKAKHPERIYFGIYNQFDEETEHYLDEYKKNNHFGIGEIPWRDARGLGVARNEAENFYNGQTYTLQLDSHMRFIPDWDEILIDEWKKCEFDKAVLTGYPPQFTYDDDGKEVFTEHVHPSLLVVRNFSEGWLPVFEAKNLPTTISKPYKAAFAAGGFMFALGNMSREVRHIREVTFPEEIAFSIQLFSHGYRMYAPSKWVMFHLYERQKYGGHYYWKNFLSDKGLAKNKVYEDIKHKSDAVKKKIIFDGDPKYLGTEASLQDFENYCGIKIKERILHPNLMQAREAPYATDDSWVDELLPLQPVPIKIKIDTSQFDMSLDYDFWLFGLRSAKDFEIIRDDIRLDNWNVPLIEINKEYMLRELPAKYVLWPHSKSRGWLERKEYDYSPILAHVKAA